RRPAARTRRGGGRPPHPAGPRSRGAKFPDLGCSRREQGAVGLLHAERLPGMTTKDRKVLLVTGGGRGIGARIALGAAKAGWRVAVNYAANADAAAEIVKHIETAGGEAFAVKGDVGSEADVLAMFAAVDE